MKKAGAPITIISVILFLAPIQMPFITVVEAEVNPQIPGIKVYSPTWWSVYPSSNLELDIKVTKPASWSEPAPGFAEIIYSPVGAITSIGYSLDGETRENITVDDPTDIVTIGPAAKDFDILFNLTHLSEGVHNVTINVSGVYKGEHVDFSEGTVRFFIDTAPLRLEVLSPKSEVYNVTDILLFANPSERVSWMGYSLDGGKRVTTTESTILRNLSAGSHNLTVFANDTIGNFAASETINFTITKPATQVPFPTTLVIGSAVIAVGCLGLLVYLKKLHRNKSP